MKKRMCAVLLLTAALLSGCAAPGQSAGASAVSASGPAAAPPAQSSAPAESAVPAAVTVDAASTRDSGPELTEEEILSAYDRAVTAYEWFDLTPLPCGGEDIPENGVLYRRVEYPGFDTLDDLRIYLRGLFSEDVVARLLPQDDPCPLYADIDGQLCVRPGGREAENGKGSAAAAVERRDDGSYRVNVTVDLLDEEQLTVSGVECYSFPYCCENGRWVFTDFQLVY